MSVQVIMKEGRPEWAVLPYDEYETLLALAEQARTAQATSSDTSQSASSQVDALKVEEGISPQDREKLRGNLMQQLSGVSQLAAKGGFSGAKAAELRESKGLDVAMIAREIGISPVYLQQIEAGEREPSEPILRNIARALDVDADLLSDDS